MRTTPTLLMLAFLTFIALATPNASAASVPSGCTGTGVGDHDGDGVPEAAGSCTGPMCGCNCPVVGEGVELVALGQDVKETVIAGCGYYVAYDANPGDVDWDGPVSITPQLYCGGGAIQCEFAILAPPPLPPLPPLA